MSEPIRVPARPDPMALAQAEALVVEIGIDAGVRRYVAVLMAYGVETFESCEGGLGHAYPEATIAFHGESMEGHRALAAALENGMPVAELRRAWRVQAGELHGPWWQMTFSALRPHGPLPWWWVGTVKDPDAASPDGSP